ncbi:TonB-dependent siderophore receptor [Methylobacillus methanolivorans]
MQLSIQPGFRLAPLVLAVQLTCLPILFASSTLANAETLAATQQYDIPAGPLAAALTRFAQQSGVAISVDANEIKPLQSPGLKGSYSIDDGFNKILAGTGYGAEKTSAGYALRKVSAVREDTSRGALPEVSVTASKTRESRATTEGTGSYAARAATIGKGEQSLRDIPQSVSVVTRQRMDEQNLTTLDNVLMQTTGVTRQARNYGHSVYYSRGFAIGNYMTDGVPMGDYGGIGLMPDTAILDRVEVMRGAPGLLIGNGDPGGTVNMVRKRPLAEKQIQLTARAGSWDYYRLDGDVTGPLNDAGTLRGRLVAGYEDRHYFVDDAQSKIPLLYGIIEADLGKDTVAAFGVRYQSYRQDGGRWISGLPRSTDGSDLKLSRSTSLGPSWTSFDSEMKEVFADLTHHLNDDWKVKLSANYQNSNRQDAPMLHNRAAVDPNTMTGLALRGIDYEDVQYRNTGVDAQLNGKFSAWGQQHEMFVGANWQRNKYAYKYLTTLYSTPIPINLNQYSLSSIPRIYRGDYNSFGSSITTTQGFYGNVRLQIIDDLKLILGGRVSWYEYEEGATHYKQTHEVTPYAALIYKLDDRWSLYGSYTDIFQPQSSNYTATNNALSPAMGKNYEAGIKGELYGGKLNTSLAVFRIDLEDVALVDPFNRGACRGGNDCYINAGKQKSQGLEAEINGEILPGWQAFAGYTYNVSKYVKTANGATDGTRLGGDHNPRHLLRMWQTYRLPGDWEKVTLGGGVTLQSETNTAFGTVKYQQSGYAVWNVFASYKVDEHWTAALNINNLFDKRYYTTPSGAIYGEPQSAMLTLRGNF